MYLSFFGLSEKPFAITPDPRYLYLSERHAEALAHLVYGVGEAGGFVQLTGEVGTGKTTIVRSLLGQVPANAEVALILNPRMSAPEFLLTICEEIGIGVPDSAEGSVKDLVDILNHYLLKAHANGRRVVLVVDEAQNLAPDVLEQVRLLTNLETHTQKLLQIILIGQPELRAMLARPELRQLAQRVTGRCHLDPLSGAETVAYVRHRLRVAGATTDIYTSAALREVHRLSGGIPRLINVICDRALLGAYTQDRHNVTSALVRRAASEVFGRRVMPAWLPWSTAAATLLIVALGLLLAWRQDWLASPPGGSASVVTPAEAATGSATATSAGIPAGAVDTASASTTTDPLLRTASVDGVATTPSMTTSDLLTAEPDATSAEAAYATLFGLWGASFAAADGDVCGQAAAQGLACLVEKGSFAQLRLYNRPAVLMLVDASGDARQLVLTRLEDEHAWVTAGERSVRVGIADLSRYWYGDFLLLWQPAAPEARGLSAGMSGPAVLRLRHSLEQLDGAPTISANDAYDESLIVLVEDFQRAHRLDVDGIAGAQTQFALDSVAPAPDTPVLVAPVGRGG